MNQANALQGRSNHPLNEDGILQAKTDADRLKEVHFDYVFSSPLMRAVQTAEIIAPHMAHIIEKRLIEMDYGPYEETDLNNLPPEIITFFRDFVHNPAPEGMEQLMVLEESDIHTEKESERKIVDWDRTYFLTNYFFI